jgi:putative endonuclease
MDRAEVGRTGEDLAASYLERHGWLIVARNVRYREGEIDIVARRNGVLAFIEVKTRRSAKYGAPAEAVTWTKQRRIRLLAARYLIEHHTAAEAIRFDVVDVARDGPGFRVMHIEDAF